jgi:uncharacterized protein (DUF1697 family)
MNAYVALLRGVNVGGSNRVPMPELRAALVARGLEDVSTVLASGNVLCRSAEGASAVADLVGVTIDEELGLRIGIIVRSAGELASVTGRNPFLGTGADRNPATLHVAFLAAEPEEAAVATLEPERSPPDAFAVDGREVFLSYPNGAGRSRLTLDYLERRLGVVGTARNWHTVQRLACLLEGLA